MLSALASVTFAGFVAALLGGSGALLTQRLWVGRAHLAPAYGVGAVGLASLVGFFTFWVNPVLGAGTAFVLVGGAVVVLVRGRAWRLVGPTIPLFVLTVGAIVFVVSLAHLWFSIYGTFYLSAVRFSDSWLPPDNSIPYFLAERVASGGDTHDLIDGWNGSDRPPLQAGFILLIDGLTRVFGHPGGFAFGASIVAQAVWIPGAYAFLRGIGVPRQAAMAGLALAAAMGSTLFNTVYTWPKLLSAGLVLASAALLTDARRHPRAFRSLFAAAAVLFALGMLAHGAAAFAAPLLVILGVGTYRRQRLRTTVTATLGGAGAAIATYLPWLLYQRFVDPPGDRLLKWHLAGVINPDDRSFLTTLIDAYAALSPGEWLAGRWTNLQVALGGDPFSVVQCWCADDLTRRRTVEFFTTTGGLGLALPALLAILAIIVTRWLRRRPLDLADGQVLLAIASSLACIVVWCLVLFIPGTTVVHQGSHVWLLVLSAAPAVWLWSRRRSPAVVLIALQLAATLLVYVPMAEGEGLNPLAVAGVLLGLLAGSAAVVMATHRPSAIRLRREAQPPGYVKMDRSARPKRSDGE